MSLKDLLPPGTCEELERKAHEHVAEPAREGGEAMVPCPMCGRLHPYRTTDPFRPFCSERCRMLDLAAWASDERVIEGDPLEDDEDAGLADNVEIEGREVPADD